VIQDTECQLSAWFEARRVDWVLIRPDRFVAATGLANSAADQLTEFCRAVLPQGAK